MATIKIVLDQRRAKINETFPVVLRIRHKDRYFDIKTNYCICKNLFDEKKQIIISNMEANFNIEEQKEMYSKRIREFLKENHATSYDINTLKRYVLQKPAELTTIEEFWKEVIQQLLDSNRTGTARSYITTFSVISKIIDCNCMFTQVSYKDLIIIETTLLKRGVSINGIAVYMRTFRAICNRAILYNVASHDWYPFRKYKIKKEKTTPRTISLHEIQQYFNYTTDPTDKLYKSWCIGKLIFMLRGINLTDLLLLKKSDAFNDRIIYKRAKTAKMYSVKILPQVQVLINEFTDNSEYLFGSLMSHYDKPTLQDSMLYADYRKKLNKKLKKISKTLAIETQITTYVFRYTYANIAKQLGYSKDLIAEALGHEYGNSVTGIYLEMFDNDIVDNMNVQIVNSVHKKRVG
jgi:integrase